MKNFSDALTPDLLSKLLSTGYVKLPSLKNYVDLDAVFTNISSEINGKTFTELSPSHEKFIDQLGLRNQFASSLYDVARNVFNFKGPINDQYHVARFVEPGNSRECYRAHFDSHIFTLALPISIPDEAIPLCSGELLLKPNARSYPRGELQNLVTKTYFKRYASADAAMKMLARKDYLIEKFSSMEPILFLGMTTLHTNAPVASLASKPRLTCLAHYFDPAPKIGVGNLLRFVRNR